MATTGSYLANSIAIARDMHFVPATICAVDVRRSALVPCGKQVLRADEPFHNKRCFVGVENHGTHGTWARFRRGFLEMVFALHTWSITRQHDR